ncbi:AAA family ATPase [Micromonospora oryzae]|uniref:AAA family ATPase n=1 Tax=Micromonospora sp. DSM 102119 TaxID=3111768 RepID=UPI0031E27D8F
MSLYQEKRLIDVVFGDGVFCLAGANGLGKSTFLAALNFAITGIVADPNQKFQSLKEYYQHSLAFSRGYFVGRVNELDRDTAEVTVWFSLGETRCRITRSLFHPQSLRRLEIADFEGVPSFIGDGDDGAEGARLHERYAATVTKAAGLDSFEQLVFLQHYLLSFDERRHLLFWDADTTRQALFLVFGIDGATASQADEWLRRSDRLESQARNAQYQATTARQRAKELAERTKVGADGDAELVERYKDLTAACDRAAQAASDSSRAAEDARYKYTIAAAKLHALTTDYDRLFSQELAVESDPALHPLVQQGLGQHECGLCGTHGDSVAQRLEEALAARKCPLCRSGISPRPRRTAEGFDKLEELDRTIAEHHKVVMAAEQATARLVAEAEQARLDYEKALQARSEFEKQNVNVSLNSQAANSSGVLALIHQLETERADAVQRRDDFRRERDEYRRRLEPVQQELAVRYLEAERSFMPQFQSLAREFLGLDLQVTLEQRARGPELALTIQGTLRRMTTQLSESQRYFVDIALRMSLAQHLCGPSRTACLIIDTPEGSLDIAYESRAGRMFGKFVKANNRLIMTANINSSQLVQELAAACGRQSMRVERMTSWTTLSEVQAESEDLFDRAYADIEAALDSGNPA